MKKNLESVENSDEVGEKSERAGGKQKGQWQNRWIKVLGSAVAAGIVYWYVTGEMDVWLYAISGGIGGIVFLREMLAARRKWQVYGGRKKNRGQERIERKARKWIRRMKLDEVEKAVVCGMVREK